TDGSGVVAQLTAGSSGQCLVSTGGVPSWAGCSESGTLTGSGNAGELAFFSSANSLSGNTSLVWDTVNSELEVNGNIILTGDLLPTVDDTQSLGSPSLAWQDVFIGPGSLYINGQKVLQESGESIVVSADPGQNLSLTTAGGGDLELTAAGGGIIQLKSNIQI